MSNNRISKLNSLVKEELAKIIQKEIDFEEGTLVTIYKVEVSSDVAHANIRISVIPDENEKKALEKAEKLLGQVGLSKRVDHKPNQMSGGEMQRVAIARSLANNPKVILADEPTGNLDTANSKMVIELLFKIKREYSVTFVIATHSEDIANAADKVLMLRDGKLNF